MRLLGVFYFFFFFFQAEDGIRDWSVTGVQTCALPISGRLARGAPDAGTAATGTAAHHPDDRGEARPFEPGEAGRSDGAGRAAQCRDLLADLFADVAAVHGEAQDRRGSETRSGAYQGPAVRYLPGSRRYPGSSRFGTGRANVYDRRIGAAAPAGSFQPVHQDHRRANYEFPEEERFGAGYSTGGRRGAS